VASPAAHLITPPRPEAVPKALSIEQVRALLVYLDDHQGDGQRERRDRALLLTGLYTGMRAKEMATTIWQQVDLPAQIIVIPRSKMNRGRTILMHPDLLPTLGAWGVYQGQQRESALPVFSLGTTPIQPERVGKVAYRYAKLLDLPLTAHVLRHT